MTNGERIETCSKAYEALTVITGAIMMGDEDTARQYLDILYTYIDDLYDVYHEYQDDDDDDDEDYDDDDDEDYEEVIDRLGTIERKVDLLTRLFNK